MTHYITPNWPAPENVQAYTTLRSLPMPSSRTVRVQTEAIANRDNLMALLTAPTQPSWLQQVHGTEIIALPSPAKELIADGAYTQQANIVCAVSTADCLPVLLCNRQGTQVAAIHAGWRGLAKGIVAKGAQVFNQAGEELVAWLGPAIGPEAFEIGEEVREQFLQLDPQTAKAFTPNTDQRWLADIYALARQQLNNVGVTTIYGGDYCTYKQNDKFLSCRRKDEGNMATLIWFS